MFASAAAKGRPAHRESTLQHANHVLCLSSSELPLPRCGQQVEYASRTHDEIINDPAALSKAVKKLKKEGGGLIDVAMLKQQVGRSVHMLASSCLLSSP